MHFYNLQPGYDCNGFRPVFDGFHSTQGAILPQRPLDLLESGDYNVVPQIVGVNEDDGSIFGLGGASATTAH